MAPVAYGWTREVNYDPLTYAGYDAQTWASFSAREQELLLDDYMRTEAQQNYVQTYLSDPVRGGAYVYTGLVDYYTGWDSAASADTGLIDDIQDAGFGSYEDTKDTLSDYGETAVDTLETAADVTKDVATIALVAGAYLLLKR